MNKNQRNKKLLRLLKVYEKADFIVQRRASFVYYLCIAALLTTFFVLIKTVVNQVTGSIDGRLNIPMLIPIFTGVVLYLLALFLLIKGYYNVSVNIILIIALTVVWIALMHSKDLSISRIDGIAYVFVVLSMIPLMLRKGKYLSFLYSFICIGFLVWFVITKQDEIGIHGRQLVDYLIDTSVAFFLIGFVGYHIHSINQSALDRAMTDIKERQDAEIALYKSEMKYKEMSDLLPQIVAEIKQNGDITYLNKAGYEKFGISGEDFNKGINLSSVLLETDFLKANIEKLLKGIHTGNRYTARRKNGETFPVQIYSAAVLENGEPIGYRSIIIDISENVKAEEALIASERKYKEMLMLLPQTVYEADLTGRLTYINKAGTDMFGHTEEEVRNGLNVLETIVTEDHEKIRESIRKLLSGEITLGNQYMGQRKDGSTFPMQIFSRPIIDNGKAVGFRGVIFDLTQIKEVENNLRQSNELFKTLIESTPVPTTISDMEGKFLMVNKAFCNDLGINPEDVLGKPITDLGITTEGEKELIINNILNEKGSVENFDITAVAKNGRKHYLYVYATLVTINNQKVMLRSTINVTDKKKLENKLRESEALFRHMVEIVPYTILIFDPDRRLKFANRAYLERFDVALDQVKGKLDTELDLIIDNETLHKIYDDISEQRKVLNKEITIFHPIKGNIYTLLSYQMVTIDEKSHYLITAVDITKLKLLEKQLKEYNQQLEIIVKERTEQLEATNEELMASNEELYEKGEIIIAKNKELEHALNHLKETQMQLFQAEKMASLGILTAGVAHEVNNPLNYLMGVYVGLQSYFQEHGRNDVKKIDILLNSMQVGIERISTIVTGLNQFSRNSDSLEETCDIHAIIDNCVTMLSNKLKHKVELTKNYAPDKIIVKGNVGRLHQVFLNIISNALQAIPDKGNIIIKTKITEAKAKIEIIDDGIGIDKKFLSKITDPFFTTKAPGEGTGLGLSIVQTIIKEHHGEMKFESEVNEGTKVVLSFPLE